MTVSFTCNIHFLNSAYLIFNQFKSDKFRVSFAVEYIILIVFKGDKMIEMIGLQKPHGYWKMTSKVISLLGVSDKTIKSVQILKVSKGDLIHIRGEQLCHFHFSVCFPLIKKESCSPWTIGAKAYHLFLIFVAQGIKQEVTKVFTCKNSRIKFECLCILRFNLYM